MIFNNWKKIQVSTRVKKSGPILGPNAAVTLLPTTQLDGTGESPLVGRFENTMNYLSYYDDAIDK